MTTKKPTDLTDIFNKTDAAVPPESVAQQRPRSIKNTKGYNIPIKIGVHEQLRVVAFEERTSINKLIQEGIDMVFKKRGLPSIENL